MMNLFFYTLFVIVLMMYIPRIINWVLRYKKIHFCINKYYFICFEILFLFLSIINFAVQDLIFEKYIFLLFLSFSSIVFFADSISYLIPNVVTYPVFLIIFILRFFQSDFLEYFYCAIVTGLILYLITLTKGLGLGDVKLMVVMSFFIKYPGICVVFWIACISSLILCLIQYFKTKDLSKPIAFGPHLVFGGVLAYFSGDYLFFNFYNFFTLLSRISI